MNNTTCFPVRFVFSWQLTDKPMITILIIDDHPLVCDGISTMVKDVDYLQIAGACKSGKEALQFILTMPAPDIILLDISLPDMNGLELCTLIRQHNKTTKIIGLTSANETGLITQLLTRGGNGYLLKNMEREELITAVSEVLNGKTYLSRAANEKLLEQFHSVNDAVEKAPVLTRREKEILEFLSKGLMYKEIAAQLYLSPETVRKHVYHVYEKLHVNNRVAAVNKYYGR